MEPVSDSLFWPLAVLASEPGVSESLWDSVF